MTTVRRRTRPNGSEECTACGSTQTFKWFWSRAPWAPGRWCGKCNARHRRTGDPHVITRKLRPSLEDRFLRHVGPPRAGDGCTIWTGTRNPGGYGQMSVEGRDVGAHRIALQLALGRDVGEGLAALHTCGNGAEGCVTAEHIYEGTHQHNMADRTHSGAEKLGFRRLSLEEVREIQGKYSEGISLRRIAVEHDLTRVRATHVARGQGAYSEEMLVGRCLPVTAADADAARTIAPTCGGAQ